METGRIVGAETLGTFLLMLGGPGSAVLAGEQIGTLGVALAFGLSLLVAAYAVGPISGCHINPAVTIGRTVSDTFAGIAPADAPAFIVFQIVGGLIGALVVWALYPEDATKAAEAAEEISD